MAKNTLASAVNPLVIWQASPTKQSCIFTELVMLQPLEMMEFSQMTPVPMYTDASFELRMVQSLSRDAPLISQSSFTTVLVISLVLIIFTPLPSVPRSGSVMRTSSRMSRVIFSFSTLSLKCFTMKAASCELRSWNSTRLPSPISLSTEIMWSSP